MFRVVLYAVDCGFRIELKPVELCGRIEVSRGFRIFGRDAWVVDISVSAEDADARVEASPVEPRDETLVSRGFRIFDPRASVSSSLSVMGMLEARRRDLNSVGRKVVLFAVSWGLHVSLDNTMVN